MTDGEASFTSAFFKVSQTQTLRYDNCYTNYCNSIEKVKTVTNYKCEFNKTKPTKSKLIYPISFSKSKSVSKCYTCDRCVNPDKEVVVKNCNDKNNTNIIHFVCDVLFHLFFKSRVAQSLFLLFLCHLYTFGREKRAQKAWVSRERWGRWEEFKMQASKISQWVTTNKSELNNMF